MSLIIVGSETKIKLAMFLLIIGGKTASHLIKSFTLRPIPFDLQKNNY